MLLNVNGRKRLVDPMEIGVLMPFRFDVRIFSVFFFLFLASLTYILLKEGRTVALDVRADGPKQVLRITNYNRDQSVYKPKRGNTLVSRQDSISSSVEAFEAVTTENVPTLSFSVDFAGIGISLVNRKLIEVIYVSIAHLSFEYIDSTNAQSVNLSCGSLQVDNQLHDALFPVILQPTPIPKESKGVAALPTVQASIILLKDEGALIISISIHYLITSVIEHGVLFVKYCSVLLQALTIEVDEDLLFALYDLTQIKGASWEEVSQE